MLCNYYELIDLGKSDTLMDTERFSDRRPADKLLNEIFGKPGK
jgi:hypothetical protein